MEANAVRQFKRGAWKKLLLGLLGSTAVVAIYLALGFAGFAPKSPFGLIPAAFPFVYFCIGFVEVVTHRPFNQLAHAWMELKGWQRGVIGTFIVVVAIATILFGVAALFTWVL